MVGGYIYSMDTGIQDWRALREALGLNINQMADVLFVTRKTVWELEKQRDRQPHGATLMHLRYFLYQHLEESHRRLEAAQIPYPWPEDLVDADPATAIQ